MADLLSRVDTQPRRNAIATALERTLSEVHTLVLSVGHEVPRPWTIGFVGKRKRAFDRLVSTRC